MLVILIFCDSFKLALYFIMCFITIITVYLIVAMCFTTTWYCVEINIWPVVWTFAFAAELLLGHPVFAQDHFIQKEYILVH